MKSRISAVVVLSALCGVSAFAWTGCSEDEKKPAPVTPTSAKCTLNDPLDPPVNCGPADEGADLCSKTANVESCPTGNECIAQVEQTGAVKNLRMGRIRLWAPDALMALTPIAVDPNVNPKCFDEGGESFTWLIQVDPATKKLRTGGARNSADSKNFAFLNESIDASKLGEICPGFQGPATAVSLNSVEVDYTETNGAISTGSIPLINVPIFDPSGLPIILPLREASIKNMTINGSCVGKFQKEYWCNSTTLGWTTGGAIVAKITAEEADRVPVKSASCQSLCAILVNSPSKVDGKVCKRGPDGKIPEIGTHCSKPGQDCKDSFLLSATFGAYGVNITNAAPPPADGGTETGNEPGTDTGVSDTGTSSDAADALSLPDALPG